MTHVDVRIAAEATAADVVQFFVIVPVLGVLLWVLFRVVRGWLTDHRDTKARKIAEEIHERMHRCAHHDTHSAM